MTCGNHKIELGCGSFKKEGFVGLDKHDYSTMYPKGEFRLFDFETGVLPFCDDSAIEMWADNVLEHIINLIPLMNDCWRVLRKDGVFHIIVPIAGSDGAWKDPTHVRFFHSKTFSYFEPCVRQDNYDIKPWKVTIKDKTEGKIVVDMTPLKD